MTPRSSPQEVYSEQVIIVRFLRGDGTEADPIRSVTQVWSHKGNFIAEDDSHTACEKQP